MNITFLIIAVVSVLLVICLGLVIWTFVKIATNPIEVKINQEDLTLNTEPPAYEELSEEDLEKEWDIELKKSVQPEVIQASKLVLTHDDMLEQFEKQLLKGDTVRELTKYKITPLKVGDRVAIKSFNNGQLNSESIHTIEEEDQFLLESPEKDTFIISKETLKNDYLEYGENPDIYIAERKYPIIQYFGENVKFETHDGTETTLNTGDYLLGKTDREIIKITPQEFNEKYEIATQSNHSL